MKIKVIFLVMIMLLSGMANMQANNRKANRYFNLYKYSKAIPLYKRSAESSNETIKREAIERLGDCYRLTNNVLEERSWYMRAIEFDNPNPILYFYLGQSYQCTEQYDEAKKDFLKYASLNPSDPRGKILAAYCDSIDSLKAFNPSAEIRNVSGVNTKYSEFGPIFYKNGVIFVSDRKFGNADEITFDWTNNGYYDLYFAEPKYYKDYWTDLANTERLSYEFNQSFHDGPICFTSDFKTAYLTRTLNKKVTKDKDDIRTNRLQILSADLKNGKIPVYTPLPFDDENYSVAHPTVSLKGNFMIFSSDMPGGYGGSDLYYVEKQNDKWTEPKNLGSVINTFGNEEFPCLVNDTILFFSSDGHLGFGGLDLFMSNFRNQTWGRPVNLLKPINSSYDDFSIIFSQEKNSGFFSSDRPGGKGSDDIYAFKDFKRPQPEKTLQQIVTDEVQKQGNKKHKSACGTVLEKNTRVPVGNATVFLFNVGSGEVFIARSDSAGSFKIPVELRTNYILKAMKEGYFDDCLNFSFDTFGTDVCQPVKQPLLLDKYELNQTFVMHNILYDLDKWNIRPDAEPALNELVRIMQQYPISIELSSHTDSRASDAYNLLLSLRRAETAKEYIVSKGVNPSRITALGFGETRLINRCANGVKCSDKEHQANRRTEFKIISLQSPDFGRKVIDLNNYREGDKLTIDQFETGFFWKCVIPAVAPVSQNNLQVRPEVVNKEAQTKAGNNIEVPGKVSENVSGETFFTVQVAAVQSSGAEARMDFKGEITFSKNIAGYTKFYIGKFTDYRSVSKERSRLAPKFPGAFIVAFKDGIVIPVSELKEILK